MGQVPSRGAEGEGESFALIANELYRELAKHKPVRMWNDSLEHSYKTRFFNYQRPITVEDVMLAQPLIKLLCQLAGRLVKDGNDYLRVVVALAAIVKELFDPLHIPVPVYQSTMASVVESVGETRDFFVWRCVFSTLTEIDHKQILAILRLSHVGSLGVTAKNLWELAQTLSTDVCGLVRALERNEVTHRCPDGNTSEVRLQKTESSCASTHKVVIDTLRIEYHNVYNAAEQAKKHAHEWDE